MASHARAPRRKLTFDQFVEAYTGREGRYELVNGEAWLMAGGTRRHAITQGLIIAALRGKLPRFCVPVGSDGWLKLNLTNARLPDVAVYCDPRDLTDLDRSDFNFPCVIFEVLSDGTESSDRRNKVPEYQRLESVRLIVLVDARDRSFETFERVSHNEWRNIQHPPETALTLTEPPLTLSAAEVFDI